MTDDQWVSANIQRVVKTINQFKQRSAKCTNCEEKHASILRLSLIKEAMTQDGFDEERATRVVDRLFSVLGYNVPNNLNVIP